MTADMNTSTTPAPVLPVVAFRYKENRGNGRFDYSYHLPEDESKAYKDNCLEIEPLCKVSDALAAIAATQSAAPTPAAKDILGAVARGWCHPINAKKVMDPDLAIAISAEVNALLDGQPAAPIAQAAQPSQPTDAERYQFLKAEAYEAVIPFGGKINGSRTAWITKFHVGSSFDEAIDAAIAASKGAVT